MKYLSLLTLILTTTVSTVQASYQPAFYWIDDESNPCTQTPEPVIAKIHPYSQKPSKAPQYAHSNTQYSLFQNPSQHATTSSPMRVPQFFNYMHVQSPAHNPGVESSLSHSTPTINTFQRHKSPVSVYEQLRREQDLFHESQVGQQPLVYNFNLNTDEAPTSLPYVPQRDQPLGAPLQFKESKKRKSAPESTEQVIIMPNPLTQVHAQNTLEAQPYSPSPSGNLPVLPLKPTPIHPTITAVAPMHFIYSLTLKDLYELAPVIVGRTPPSTNSLIPEEYIRRSAVEFALTTTPITQATIPHDYAKIVLSDGADPSIDQKLFLSSLHLSLQKHLNPKPNHLANVFYHSLLLEKERLQQLPHKRIEDHTKLSKLKRGIPMLELFGTPENFEFSAKLLINSLYDSRILPSKRFAIYTLLTNPIHYGSMLDLHHHTRIMMFEDDIKRHAIFTLPHFSKRSPLKLITEEEKTGNISPLRNRPYIMGGVKENDSDTHPITDFFKMLSFRELMGEETSPHKRSFTFHILMHEKAAPLIRALALHFKANRLLGELQANNWVVDDYFNAETARQCLELAYNALESLSFREINDTSIRQQKLAFKQALLHEINEDANALRFLFTYD